VFSVEVTVRLSGFVKPHEVSIWMNKSRHAPMDRTYKESPKFMFLCHIRTYMFGTFLFYPLHYDCLVYQGVLEESLMPVT
jgi:hypothetical protein